MLCWLAMGASAIASVVCATGFVVQSERHGELLGAEKVDWDSVERAKINAVAYVTAALVFAVIGVASLVAAIGPE